MSLDREIAGVVLRAYDLGDLAAAPVLIARGAMGEVSRVDSDLGTHVIKELFPWNPGAGVEHEVAFTARARTSGLRIPLELRSVAGGLVVSVDSRRFRVYEWYDLGPAATPPVNATVASRVGRITGTLHHLGGATTEQLDPWYATVAAAETWRELARQAAATSVSWASALAAVLPSLTELTALVDSANRGPFRECHRDLVPSNVLPRSDHELAVLDWENLGPLEPEQEIASLLISWCTDGVRVDASAVDAFNRGYRGATGHPWSLRRTSFATAAATWLNFLAAQSEAALDVTQDAGHRNFGETCVHALLTAALFVRLVDEVLAAAG